MIKMDDKPPAIGIDLGTTYSCVAVYQYVKVEIIVNDQGHRTTPSCVAFTDKERLIGNAAKDQISENHQNTVYDVKRLIGRMYNEEAVQQDRNHLSFKVIDKAGKPNVSVSYKNETRTFTPEQISAMILGKMKEIAESFLGCKVKDAVITVPAYFNDAQRRATKDAGIIAGLNVLRIINEPTAAALAYGLDQKTQGEQNVLIFDLGGGTFDVSILTIDDGVFNAIATSGNTHLGGEDFDIRIVKYFVKIIREMYEKDISDDKRALRRLQTACEQAKRMLSSHTQTSVYVESLFDGIDFKHKLTRAKFEDLCCDLFDSTLDQVTKALKDAQMEKSDIDEVILVGGSTRIPYIQTRLRDYFNGIELNTKIDPDEAVAYGAAVQAAILNGDMSKEIQDILLLDISPLSLGLQTEGGLMTHFIKRNCSIPTSVTKLFSTTRDNQTSVLLQIFEGERPLVKDNYLLGSFQLNGIPPAPRKVPLIEVTFEIDANGILNVSAVEKNSGNKRKITITNDKKNLTKDQIDKMIIEAEIFRKDDEAQREKILAQNMLREYAYQLKSTILQDGFRARMLIEEQKQVENKVEEILKWLKANGNAFKSDYECKLKELNTICLPILAKYKEKSSKIISNGTSHSGNGTFLQNHLTNGKHENNHDKSRSGPTIEELN